MLFGLGGVDDASGREVQIWKRKFETLMRQPGVTTMVMAQRFPWSLADHCVLLS